MIDSTRLPWHAALAWIVTRDDMFTEWSTTSEDCRAPAFLAHSLFQDMEECGCFVTEDIIALEQPAQKLRLSDGYDGRFARLAADYERGGRSVDLTRPVLDHLEEAREAPPVLGIFKIGPISKHFPITIMPRGEISVPDYILFRVIYANAQLCAAAGQGLIFVNGVEVDGDRIMRATHIPQASFVSTMCLDFWGILHQETPDRERESLRATERSIPAYKTLSVQWVELVRLFAASPGINAESRCLQWLTEIMRKSPECRPKPRAEFFTAALGRFDGLIKEQFNRAWKTAIAATGATAWATGGRPSKNPRKNPSAQK